MATTQKRELRDTRGHPDLIKINGKDFSLTNSAPMVKLANTFDLRSNAFGLSGSNPDRGTFLKVTNANL